MKVVSGAAVAAAVLLAAATAQAKTIVGSPKGDVLKGTARADKLDGKVGDDRLYGYGGNDVLRGGPGADVLLCGSGRDVAIADKRDTVNGCEVVRGLPKPTPPPPPPPGDDHLYLALGTSISAGLGASKAEKAWVSLYFGYGVERERGDAPLQRFAAWCHQRSDSPWPGADERRVDRPAVRHGAAHDRRRVERHHQSLEL